MAVRFFDCVSSDSLAGAVETYLFLDGISDKLGFRKFDALRTYSNQVIEIKSSARTWQDIATTIVKLASYLIFPLLLAALAAKVLYRLAHNFKIASASPSAPPKIAIEPQKPTLNNVQIPSEIDIRGTKWLNGSRHLTPYNCYLRRKYPKIKFQLHWFEQQAVKDGLLIEARNGIFTKDYRYFASPLHINGNHWTLVLVDSEKRTIEYFDSFAGFPNNIESFLKDTAKELSQIDKGKPAYKVVNKTTTRFQNDGYQCGVWVYKFLEARIQNPETEFNQVDLAKASKEVAEYRALMQERLLGMHRAENKLK